jgi:hypothetical protein
MLLERRREGVEPMRRADEIFERITRRDILDAKGNDRNGFVDGALDLAFDLWGRIRVAGNSTITRAPFMAPMIDAAQPTPGTMSRGAIQTRMRLRSSTLQTASAAALSFDE